MSNVTSPDLTAVLDACLDALEHATTDNDRALLLRASLRGLESQLHATAARCKRIRRAIKVEE